MMMMMIALEFGSRPTLGKLSRVLSRICEFFSGNLNKNFTEFFNVRKFREILHYSLLIGILESSNFT